MITLQLMPNNHIPADNLTCTTSAKYNFFYLESHNIMIGGAILCFYTKLYSYFDN